MRKQVQKVDFGINRKQHAKSGEHAAVELQTTSILVASAFRRYKYYNYIVFHFLHV